MWSRPALLPGEATGRQRIASGRRTFGSECWPNALVAPQWDRDVDSASMQRNNIAPRCIHLNGGSRRLQRLYMDPSSVASTPFFGGEVRLLTYIRPLTAASI